MKPARVTIAIILILCIAAIASGQDSLEKAEALEILEKLADKAATTWIPAGTIQARHERYRAARVTSSAEVEAAIQGKIRAFETETDKLVKTDELQKLYLDAIPFNTRYELANESKTSSNVTVKYDGSRFYWEIYVTSRSDSVQPSADLAGNSMLERSDLSKSRQRIYTWDGQDYTIYTATANHAIVDAANELPRAVNGPLTAGLIPWGSGALSSAALSSAETSATEVARDGTTQIEMAIEQIGGLSMVFMLDPAKDYAVTSCTITSANRVASHYYSGYRQVAGSWVPTTVLIEQHDLFTDRLLASDKWDLTSIEGSVPSANQFEASYRADTVVEYHSPVATKASVYNYSNQVDTDMLLAEHLAYAAKSGRGQNCATAAIKHAAARLGKTLSDDALAPLVGPEGQTSMARLARFAARQGLYCRAVRTDLATLSNLPACQAILHIPGRNHFVVLDRVDETNAWIIDLSNSKFYYRKDKAFLPMDWSEGTALLLSTEPINGRFDELDLTTLGGLTGGAGWSCTRLLQDFHYEPCSGTDYDCWGLFKYYYRRRGCESAASGSCSEQSLARMLWDDCYWDYLKGACAVEGGWEATYIDACE